CTQSVRRKPDPWPGERAPDTPAGRAPRFRPSFEMRPPPPPRGSYRGPLPPKVRSVAHLGAWVLLAACSDDPTVPQEPVPTELVLSATSIAFEALDDTLQLTATVQDQYGESMPDFPVTWTSTAEDVATVSDEGLVRAVAVGEATVRAAAAGLEAQA